MASIAFARAQIANCAPSPQAQAALAVDTVMGRVGVGDMLLPTEGGYPACRLVEAMLRLGQDSLVPGYVQLDADSSRDRWTGLRTVDFDER